MAEPIKVALEVEGADKAAADMQKVAAGLKQVGQASSQTAPQLDKITEGQKGAAQAAARSASQMANLGIGLSKLDPKLASLANGFAGAATNIVTFGATLGPVGVAVAAVSAVLPSLIDAMQETGQSFRDTQAAVANAARGLEHFIGVAQRAAQAQAQATRLAKGAGTEAEAQGVLYQRLAARGAQGRQANELARSLGLDSGSATSQELVRAILSGDESRTRRASVAGAYVGGADVDEAMRSAVALARRVRDSARELEAAERGVADATRRANEEQMRDEGLRLRTKRERDAAEAARDGARAHRDAGAAARERAAAEAALFAPRDTLAGLGRSLTSEFGAMSNPDLDNAYATPNTDKNLENDALLDGLKRTKDAEAERDRARQDFHSKQKQRHKEEIAMASQIAGVATESGQMLLEAFGATEGQKELWKGISDVAAAATSIAGQNYPQAVLYGISSALHFKNAAEMGVGGGSKAAIPGAAGGGPESAPGSQRGGNSGGPITINLSMPNALMTESEKGVMIDSLLRAARREGRI